MTVETATAVMIDVMIGVAIVETDLQEMVLLSTEVVNPEVMVEMFATRIAFVMMERMDSTVDVHVHHHAVGSMGEEADQDHALLPDAGYRLIEVAVGDTMEMKVEDLHDHSHVVVVDQPTTAIHPEHHTIAVAVAVIAVDAVVAVVQDHQHVVEKQVVVEEVHPFHQIVQAEVDPEIKKVQDIKNHPCLIIHPLNQVVNRRHLLWRHRHRQQRLHKIMYHRCPPQYQLPRVGQLLETLLLLLPSQKRHWLLLQEATKKKGDANEVVVVVVVEVTAVVPEAVVTPVIRAILAIRAIPVVRLLHVVMIVTNKVVREEM